MEPVSDSPGNKSRSPDAKSKALPLKRGCLPPFKNNKWYLEFKTKVDGVEFPAPLLMLLLHAPILKDSTWLPLIQGQWAENSRTGTRSLLRSECSKHERHSLGALGDEEEGEIAKVGAPCWNTLMFWSPKILLNHTRVTWCLNLSLGPGWKQFTL